MTRRRPVRGGDQLAGVGRPAAQVALGHVAPQLGEEAGLLGGLDALGHHAVAQAVAQADDGRDDGGVAGSPAQPGREAAIDLEDVGFEPGHVGQRRVPGPQVVERHPHTAAPKPGEHRLRGGRRGQQLRLGDLQAEGLAGSDEGAGTGDVGGEAGIGQLAGGHVDAHRDLREAGPAAAPGAHLLGGCLQHPVAHLDHQAALLGHLDEALGSQQAERGVLPPQQRLEAGEPPGAQLDLRLVEEAQLVAADGVQQRRLDVEALVGPVPKRLVEHRDGAAAPDLGQRAGGVGLAQQHGGRNGPAGPPTATPTLAAARISRSATTTGWWSAVSRCEASQRAFSWSFTSSHRMAKASAAKRATVSLLPTARRSRRATSRRTASPPSWPMLSFTTLNRSRFRKSTARVVPDRRAVVVAASTTSVNPARLSRPVSRSCLARWASSRSARTRSVTSTTWEISCWGSPAGLRTTVTERTAHTTVPSGRQHRCSMRKAVEPSSMAWSRRRWLAPTSSPWVIEWKLRPTSSCGSHPRHEANAWFTSRNVPSRALTAMPIGALSRVSQP